MSGFSLRALFGLAGREPAPATPAPASMLDRMMAGAAAVDAERAFLQEIAGPDREIAARIAQIVTTTAAVIGGPESFLWQRPGPAVEAPDPDHLVARLADAPPNRRPTLPHHVNEDGRCVDCAWRLRQ